MPVSTSITPGATGHVQHHIDLATAINAIGQGLPDPTSLPNGYVPTVQGGAWVPLAGGGGGGNANFVYYTSGAWGARPSTTNPVIYISTNDASAVRAVSMQVYDMWIRHPDALEAL